jgi:hypothetical protein
MTKKRKIHYVGPTQRRNPDDETACHIPIEGHRTTLILSEITCNYCIMCTLHLKIKENDQAKKEALPPEV